MEKSFATVSRLFLRVLKIFRNVELGNRALTILTGKNCALVNLVQELI